MNMTDPQDQVYVNETMVRQRPRIDWSRFTNETITKHTPVVFLKHEEVEDGYEKFKRISSKVSNSRYDIPDGHSLIVAYSHIPFTSKPPEPVGVITYKAGDKSLQRPRKSNDHMDDYYHKVSFLFVDRDHQKRGIGKQLLQEVLNSLKKENHYRPVRLEGAKSAVKFFRKMGFVCRGKPNVFLSRKGSRLFREIQNMQFFF